MFALHDSITSLKKPEQGFTLIELMVTLAVVAILAMIAVPSFTDFITRTQVRSMSLDFQEDIKFASDQARSRGEEITLAIRSAGVDWSNGYHVWLDTNNNSTVDTDETVLRYRHSLAESATINDVSIPGSPAAVDTFRFERYGNIKGLLTLNLIICPKNTASTVNGRSIGILPSGMVTMIDRNRNC